MAERICSIDDCRQPPHARGWCSRHYNRWYRHGDVSVALQSRKAPPGSGDSITYQGAHSRVRILRGRASAFPCVACAGPARDWAYIHGSPKERVDELGRVYSPDVMDYMPMCKSCHTGYDRTLAKQQASRVG